MRDPKSAFCDAISVALIGSCTNSSYEDMSRAADVARQGSAHGAEAAVSFLVTPGSEQIRATIERDGQMRALREIGGVVLANACGPCIGQWRRGAGRPQPPNTIVTSYNRNFPGRNDGLATTLSFIASPEIVTAFALAGRLSFNPLTDSLPGADGKPFRLAPPRPAPEVPARGFARDRSRYLAPPADGRGVKLEIDPASKRLQRMEPWPAWDGRDFVDLPLLLKTRGKTTTDQISPAGPWLAYRGHLDRFSDNLLMGAVDAFTGETAPGHREARARDLPRTRAALGRGRRRELRRRQQPRARRALSAPARLRGRDRAELRAHPRIQSEEAGPARADLRDPADYDRIRAATASGFSTWRARTRPGGGVRGEARRRHGRDSRAPHSFSAAQLEWFRAGSALNVLTAPDAIHNDHGR